MPISEEEFRRIQDKVKELGSDVAELDVTKDAGGQVQQLRVRFKGNRVQPWPELLKFQTMREPQVIDISEELKRRGN